jgi:hypothetical protein
VRADGPRAPWPAALGEGYRGPKLDSDSSGDREIDGRLGGNVLREIVTNLSLLGVGVLFGGTLYDAVVLAPNLRGGPGGLEHGRLFMARATPANLFRVVAPATQMLTLLAVVVNWSSPRCRWPLAGALLALAVVDVITFTYHYPRNRLFFTAPLTVAPKRLDIAAHQWAKMNLVRVALVLGAWLAVWIAVVRIAHESSSWPFA